MTVPIELGRVLLTSTPLLRFTRYLKQLNLDQDLLSQKNFDIYDPIRHGQNLVLDGQTLAHIEVSPLESPSLFGLS